MRGAEARTDVDQPHQALGTARDTSQPRDQERNFQRLPRGHARGSRMARRFSGRLITVAVFLLAPGSLPAANAAAQVVSHAVSKGVSNAVSNTTSERPPRIVALGDSLTSGRGIGQ